MNERMWQWAEYTRNLESRLQEYSYISSGLPSREGTFAKSDIESLCRRISAAEVWKNQIGAVNPRPAGLHDYLIQCFKKTMRRILTWYTRPIIEYSAAVTESLSDVTRCLEAHENQLSSILQRGNATKPRSFERVTSLVQNGAVDNDNPDVIRDISPQDGMLVGNVDHYFDVGFSALHCIRIALNAAGKQTCKTILDLPCGHGRVLRTLKAAFPQAQLTACDLLHDGVDFCARAFGATPVYAEENPARMVIPGLFDLIWSGSLLTHLNKDRWDGFLSLFESLLSPSGVVVFTVHGRRSVQFLRDGTCNYGFEGPAALELLRTYEQEGFGYLDYPNTNNYGISISSPSWVLSQLARHPGLRVLTYMEQGWDDHQDVVACLRV
jgi:SAM-dependent methyltransferase